MVASMKAQQQTLSVRISDAMRRRLEAAQRLISGTNGEAVSISDVAKRFLESADDDRIEAADLLAKPTETLLNIRRKWERGLSLSRPEWQVLGYYIQQGCEHMAGGGPQLPTAESYIDLMKAFIAALGVRGGAKNVLELDHYYLGNLGDFPDPDGKGVNLDTVVKLSRRCIEGIREAGANGKRPRLPVGVGRNLYVVFRDEPLRGVEPLNEALRPYMRTLFRVAARGHYLFERKPVREESRSDLTGVRPPHPPPVVVGSFRLSTALEETNEFSMLLVLEPHRVLYPLEPYPVIREFDVMLTALASGEQLWRGQEFFGYTGKGDGAFNFRRIGNGITLNFSSDEWAALCDLIAQGLALPELQPALKDSELAYGEI
jgi:hypothetical protein